VTVLLYAAVAAVVYGLGAAVVVAASGREPAGMPLVARRVVQAVLRRALGARPKAPRHRTTSGKGVARHA
jgi:hypothetical protein